MTGVGPAAAASWLACCGSPAWADGMTAAYGPPVRGRVEPSAALRTGEELWWSLDEAQWRAALGAHPRIGERPAPGSRERSEQAGVESAGDDVRSRLAAGNAAYEDKFSMMYIVRAAGRDAAELLALLGERLGNEPGTELGVAAGQQWEITALRVVALLGAP